MKQERKSYYRSVLQRGNISRFILDLFLMVASYPRLMLEVFTRKNFGQRYFSLPSMLTVAVLLGCFPVLMYKTLYAYGNQMGFWFKYASWYVGIAAFLYYGWQRHKEIKRNPSVFDFARFSLYSGDIDPRFEATKLFGKKHDVRTIETLLEPGFFLAIGIILSMMGQAIGMVIIISAIIYGLSYMAAYNRGDHFLMDKIDEIICNEELRNIIVHGLSPHKTRGVKFYGQRPSSLSDCEKLASACIDDDDPTFAI